MFSVIFATDSTLGFGYKNTLPWKASPLASDRQTHSRRQRYGIL